MLGVATVDKSREFFLHLGQQGEVLDLEELLQLSDEVPHASIAPGSLLGDEEGFYSQIQAYPDHPGEGAERLTAPLNLPGIVPLKDVWEAKGVERLDQRLGMLCP